MLCVRTTSGSTSLATPRTSGDERVEHPTHDRRRLPRAAAAVEIPQHITDEDRHHAVERPAHLGHRRAHRRATARRQIRPHARQRRVEGP